MTWLALAVRFGGLAILVPVALVGLDVPEFLVWQILSTVATFTGLADFGFQPTFARLIAFSRGGGRTLPSSVSVPRTTSTVLELSQLLSAQRWTYALVSSVASVGVLLCGYWFLREPVNQLNNHIDGWGALVATAAAAFVTVQNGGKSGALLGFDLVAAVRRNELVVSLAQLASTAAVIVLTGDLLLTVLCYSIWSVPLLILNARRLAAVTKGEGTDFRVGDKAALPVVWSASWRSGVGIATSFGVMQALALVTAGSETIAQAASHLLALRLVTALSQFSQAPFYAKLPAMAGLKGSGDRQELVALALRRSSLAYWTYVLGAVVLLAFLPLLLSIIGSEVPAPGAEFMVILLCALFFERYVGMHVQLYSLTGHIVWHKLNFAIGGAALVAYWLLHPILGALAFPVALLIGYLGIGAAPISILSLTSLDQNWFEFERRASLLPAMVLVASCTVSVLIALGILQVGA